MAVNIVNVGFKGTYPSSTADKTGYVSDLDENDVFYFLGTNYGTSAWSNPQGGTHLTTSLSGNVAGSVNASTDNGTSSSVDIGSAGANIDFNFLTCKVQPTRIDINYSRSGSGNTTFTAKLQVDRGSGFEDASDLYSQTFASGSSTQTITLTNINANSYFDTLRIRAQRSNTQMSYFIREIKIYGNLFRTDGGEASSITPITTLEALPKFIPEVGGVQDGDILYYRGGVITNQRNTYYETERLVLTGNLALSNNHFPNFYILDPNGAARTVTLPPTPLDNQFFRIKTLDPNFAITIDDSGTVTTLDTSTLVTDLYWDGTEWTALNYG